MKLFNLSILAILSLTSSSVNATCYATGNDGDKNIVMNALANLCTTGQIAGEFNAGTAKHFCLPAGKSYHYDVAIFNTKSGPNFLYPLQCRAWVGGEAVNCLKGGWSSYSEAGFRVDVDPNPGSCQ
ncbi:hypothetical protein DSL72_007463 [Monilinia vaccinii-corymbosi]|uniref:Secreted protein n=1 Tax=Monilinia vaccinii-corymbosi TaxID=61207 RepID=A0A8A3PLP2_9HELO|nr:hypothetical protein DSL72_007463 [Monilinia vaccinii-corymbosi]